LAVIVEGISVIIKLSSILNKYPGGWLSFQEHVPNYTLCADGELVRIGFLSPDDVKGFIHSLRRHNIIYLHEGKPRDLTVVDQSKGPIVPCDWIHFEIIDLEGNSEKQISTCRVAGSCIDKVLTPDGWEYDKSLSSSSELYIPQC
jgi:hypothetical protein